MQKSFFIFTAFFLLFFLFPGKCNAQQIKNVKITLHLQNSSLKDAIELIERLTPFKFLAKANDIENEHNVNIDVTAEPLNKVLDKLLRDRNLEFKQVDANIIIKRRVENKTSDQAINMTTSGNLKYSLHGTIKSQMTGETVIGATISVVGAATRTLSNEYGFYSLTLAKGNYMIEITSVAMKAKKIPVSLIADEQLTILMEEDAQNLETVTVITSESSRRLKNPQMSVERINMNEIKNIPVLFGEHDVMKTIQLLPGIKSAGDGNSGFYVRGGAADQNLILLDEAPVYNATHLLGFFSTFNSDAIKNVNVYKGGMPPQYGGRLSSVVDIRMNDGNNQHLGVSGGIGLIASRLNIEAPLKKDKSSFLLSARRTYVDMFLKLLGDSSLKKTSLYFYDLNMKINLSLGEKNKLYLSGYFGRDVLSQDRLAGINWGNATGTLRWNHIFNKKLFSNTSIIFSNYNYRITINSKTNNFQILSQIRDWDLKEELQWYKNAQNTITVGFNSIFRTIKPGEISITDNQVTQLQGLPDRYSLENSLYANNLWKISNRWGLSYGLRVSAFTILGKGDYYNISSAGSVIDTIHYHKGQVVETYINPEPRISANYQLNSTSVLKASYTRNIQNLHLISNSTSLSPTDKWVASTNIIQPEIADQVAIGFYKNFNGSQNEFSSEVYYKSMQNQIDYRNGAQVFTNQAIESQLLYGKGRAYGIEWLMKKKAGKVTGWLSYTLSKSERKIDGINNNNWYNVRQDRTHDLAIVFMYTLNKKWTLSAAWVFYTGDAVTYPGGKYKIDGEVYFYYSDRNSYRMPAYHRLDVGATKLLKKKKTFSSELNFSIYNVYGRANAYQINFRESPQDPDKTEAVKTSLFTFVPSISYNFKF